MPVTPTIQSTVPTVGGSADTWGSTLNSRVGETYTDINALADQGNASETAIAGKVAKAGDTMSGDLVAADVGATSSRSVGFRGAPVVSIDVDRTFGVSDAGKMIRLFGATSRTWTIPNTSSVGFQVGTVIVLRNFSTGVPLVIARAAGVTLRTAGTTGDSNKSLASFGMATLVMEDNNIWVVSGSGVS